MTVQLLAVRAGVDDVAERVLWSRVGVRLAPAPSPAENRAWTWVEVLDAGTSTLAPVAQRASDAGPAVLLVRGEWRTGLQVWHRGQIVGRFGWSPVEGPPAIEETAAAARAAGRAFDVGSSPLIGAARAGEHGWLDALDHLGVPLPTALLEPATFSLEGEPGARRLEARTVGQAFGETGRDEPLPESPPPPAPARGRVRRALRRWLSRAAGRRRGR